MNYGVIEPRRPTPDTRWGKANLSLGALAENLDRALAEKQVLERRLAEALEENRRLSAQVSDGQQKLQDKPAISGRHYAEFAARERLLKDEYERRVQALQTEFNKERHQHAKRLEQMKMDMANCICKEVRIDQPEQHDNLLVSQLPPGWKLGNSR